ncbi:MAG: hypothetical protein ABIC40_04965, partial [bacterium]
ESDISKLLKTERIVPCLPDMAPKKAMSSEISDGKLKIHLPIGESVDIKSEIEKIQKELDSKQSYASSLTAKLSNPAFTEKAPAKVIQKEGEKLAETEKLIKDLEDRLKLFESSE